jgi:hypothetical protein
MERLRLRREAQRRRDTGLRALLLLYAVLGRVGAVVRVVHEIEHRESGCGMGLSVGYSKQPLQRNGTRRSTKEQIKSENHSIMRALHDRRGRMTRTRRSLRTKLELREHAVPVRGGLHPLGLVGLAIERETGGGAGGELGVIESLLPLILVPAPEAD